MAACGAVLVAALVVGVRWSRRDGKIPTSFDIDWVRVYQKG
jgi:hypothetical protein